jgi:hypothetical protein
MAAVAKGAEMEKSVINLETSLRERSDMADSVQIPSGFGFLFPRGNSTSAREAITILKLSGHVVEVCDPNPYCLARFSRLVRKLHRCPGLRDDPAGFLGFVEKLLAAWHFDVLLPTHEQGFLFARAATVGG